MGFLFIRSFYTPYNGDYILGGKIMMNKKEIAQLFTGILLLVGNIIGGHYITGGIILLLAIMFLSIWFIAIYYSMKFPED